MTSEHPQEGRATAILILIVVIFVAMAWLHVSAEEAKEKHLRAVRGGFDPNVGPAPYWQVTAWQSDGQGGWPLQPVLTIGDTDYRFDTAQEYVTKLEEFRSSYEAYEDLDANGLESVIRSLEAVQPSFVKHPTALPLAQYFESRAYGPKASPASTPASISPIHFSPEVGDSGRVAFANLMKSLYARKSDGFLYWRGELFEKHSGDAVEYAGRVVDLAWAESTVLYVKIFRNAIRFDRMPRSVCVSFLDAMATIETFLSSDQLPPVPRILAPPDMNLGEDPLERGYTILERAKSGAADEGEQRELLAIADTTLAQFAVRYTLGLMTATDSAIVEALPCNFSQLAVVFALIAHEDKSETALSERCAMLAALCASQVSRDDATFADVATTFRDCQLPLPEYSPRLGSEHSVRITFDGEVAVTKRGAPRGTSVPARRASAGASLAAARTERDIARSIDKALMGLVGLDRLKTLFAMDLSEFLSGGQSKGRIFWGPSGVGKTEVAQRLAGLRDGFPGLSIEPGGVRYISGVDGKLEVKSIVDSLEPMSVLFVDEADKCLDPNAGMVSSAEATQTRHAVLTHFQRKPILWVFLGVFSNMRDKGSLTDAALRVNLGDELAHRLDYADWEFPAWTLESLLKAINGTSSRRRLRYEDEAALLLANYCIKTGGGVRAFDNLETAIARHMRTESMADGTVVPLQVARDILARRGVSLT